MDTITYKEIIGEVKSLQERGLTAEGAIKVVQKNYEARVVLMQDGTEVAMGDLELKPMGEEPKEMEEEEDKELPAKEVEGMEDEEDDGMKGLSTLVRKAVAAELKSSEPKVLPKSFRADPVARSADLKSFKIPAHARHDKARNFKGVKNGVDPNTRAYAAGCWYLDKISKSIPSFQGAFPQAEKFLENYGMKVNNIGTGSDGRFVVDDLFGTDIIDLREEFGVARQILKIRPMNSEVRTDPRRDGGLTANFTPESSSIGESSKVWSQVTLRAKKLTALTRYTRELNEDAVISIGDDLTEEIAYAFSVKEDDVCFNGDGSADAGEINGFIPRLLAASGATATTPTFNGGVIQGDGAGYGGLTLANFESLVGRLPQYAAGRGIWVAHRSFYWGVMKRLELAAGGVTATEVSNGNTSGQFLGSPVVISQAMPFNDASGQIPVLFGDFKKAASFGDRSGVEVDFSEHATVGGENVFERGEIAVRGIERFDINVHDVGNTATAGPVVGLITG